MTESLDVLSQRLSLSLDAFYAGVVRGEQERAEAERVMESLREAEQRRNMYAITPVPVTVTDWPTSLYPCGGDLPPCYVKNRESHGDYNARNNSSPDSACGAWQMIGSTWRTVREWIGAQQYPTACDAPPAVQDEAARALWNGGAGCSAWSAC